ncbi:hypothetical protein [Roseateles asaccharophilus]|uniref:Uncharacterized protein n=1 Tax=Roseateles asaccharophilus TaxID=582607 RepID=A0ABU2AGD6_9BURK|nr:hypothetical protein [Roseateles asaccharophilus]MDR7335517.1 hypothetical protein [Roseateles asaccharophilus]
MTSLWAIEPAGGVPQVHLVDESLLNAIASNGISPSTARQALLALPEIASFELVAPDGLSLHQAAVPVGDWLQYSWFPIVSQRAFDLLVKLGCSEDEFIDVRVRVLGDEPFKAHLPLKSYDVLDWSTLVARHSIPLQPPIPFYIESVSSVAGVALAPPCFRVQARGHLQVLGEVFAQEHLRAAWQVGQFEGVVLRSLCSAA